MSYDEEIWLASKAYLKEIFGICPEDACCDEIIEENFLSGAKKAKELILKMADEYVDRMIKDIPTPSYDYEEGLRFAYKSMLEYLHIKLD